jgi:hypothetical protein
MPGAAGDLTLRSIQRTGPPSVVTWYLGYRIFMLLLSLAIVAAGVLSIVFHEDMADDETSPEEIIVIGGMLLLLGGLMCLAFLVSFFLPLRPWAWVYHIVMIAAGMITMCTLPFSILLLIYWVKDDTRAYFGWQPAYIDYYQD